METLRHEWQKKWLQSLSLAVIDSGARVRVESQRPHLEELNVSPLTICNIRDGSTTFGLSTSSPDIELMGDDILKLHCTLEYDGEAVSLVPEPGALCFIGSARVVKRTRLSQGILTSVVLPF
jgi:hypothetical protein